MIVGSKWLEEENEHFLSFCLFSRVLFGGGSIIVWGEIAINNCADLVSSTTLWALYLWALPAQRYIEEVLDSEIYYIVVGENFILMPPVFMVVWQYLKENNISTLDQPDCSHDLTQSNMSVGPARKAFTVHKTNPQLWMNWNLLFQKNGSCCLKTTLGYS